jgi:hypothetical protein
MMGAEARILGHGGIRAVARAARVSETTVRKGVDELKAGEEPLGQMRRPGGGRKRSAELDPELRPALLALVEPDERGVDTTTTALRVEVLRDRYRSRLPERLQELAGPVEGNVDLPLHIVWSGRTSYSLDRPKSRMTLYRTVLAEGLREDLVVLLHHRLLTEQWPVLRRLISPYIREVWEDAFPELLHTAPADTTAA